MRGAPAAYPLNREGGAGHMCNNPAPALVLCLAGLTLLLFCFLPAWLLCALGAILTLAGAALLFCKRR